MIFEWDENKRKDTLKARGIDFVDAILIWKDPIRQEKVDWRGGYNETRYRTIGKSKIGILFVVYTEREYEDGEEVIRIISARKAEKQERIQYEKMIFSMGFI